MWRAVDRSTRRLRQGLPKRFLEAEVMNLHRSPRMAGCFCHIDQSGSVVTGRTLSRASRIAAPPLPHRSAYIRVYAIECGSELARDGDRMPATLQTGCRPARKQNASPRAGVSLADSALNAEPPACDQASCLCLWPRPCAPWPPAGCGRTPRPWPAHACPTGCRHRWRAVADRCAGSGF